VTTFGRSTLARYSPKPLSLAIPLWVGAVNTGDGVGTAGEEMACSV